MTVSVVIPTYNRRDQLLRCLEALAGQEGVTTSFEVVVVLDGCADDTANALRSLATPFTFRVLAQPNRGPAAERLERLGAGWITLYERHPSTLPELLGPSTPTSRRGLEFAAAIRARIDRASAGHNICFVLRLTSDYATEEVEP